MQVELENKGERRTVSVGKGGTVYVGKEYSGKEIEIAFEVQE